MRKLVRVLEATLKGPQTAPSARLIHDLTHAKEGTTSAGNHPDFQPGTGSATGRSGTNSKRGPTDGDTALDSIVGHGVGHGSRCCWSVGAVRAERCAIGAGRAPGGVRAASS
jgi:hypothetical protein